MSKVASASFVLNQSTSQIECAHSIATYYISSDQRFDLLYPDEKQEESKIHTPREPQYLGGGALFYSTILTVFTLLLELYSVSTSLTPKTSKF